MLLNEETPRPVRVALRSEHAVFILAATETISWGLLYYSFGVLLRPMALSAHASVAEVAGAFSLALLAAGLVAPAVGRAVDRHGAGIVMTLGSLSGAVCFAMLSAARSTAHLYVVWACLGVVHACTSYEPAFTAVTGWFEDLGARRRALLVITSVAGLASTIFVPVTAWLSETTGLATTALIFAAVLGFVVTPLHATISLVRAAEPSPTQARAHEAEAPRTGIILLACVFAVHAFASTGASVFLFPSLVDADLSASDAAMLAGLVGASQVPARLLYEPMCRIVSSRSRLSLLLAVQAMALVSWGTLDGVPRAAALVAFGASNGLVTLERATLVSEWFGVRGYGARSGILAAAGAFARSGAPLCVALIVGRTSYSHAFMLLACALVVATGVHVLNARGRERARAHLHPR